MKNLRYTGDVVLQKNYIVDHLSHKEVKNHGEVPMFHVKNAHPALIEHHLFEQAAKIRELRKVSQGNSHYPYGKMLKCPLCGETLEHGSLDGMWFGGSNRNLGGAWGCYGANGCRHYLIVQRVLDEAMLEALHEKYELEYKRVDYFWMEDLIDSIRLSADDSVTVIWRDQDRTQRKFHVTHEELRPANSAAKYNQYLLTVTKRKRVKKHLMGLPK